MRLKRAAGWLAALLAVGVLAALALAWVAGREATLQWAAERAVRATDGRLQIDAPAGSLYGDIRAPRLEWRDDTVHVVLHDVRLQYELRPLLRRHLVVNALSARHVELRLHESEDAPAQPRSPPQLPEHLELPLRLTLQQARIDRLSVTPVGAEQPIDLDAIALAADYDGSRFAIERFALQTPWGRGAVDGTVGDRAPYPLALRLRFEPAQLDAPIDATVGGDLQRLSVGAASQARGASVRLDARLAPLAQDPLQALTALSAQAEGVDLAAWGEGLPSTQLQIGLEATGTERAALTVRNAMPGPIDAQRLPLGAVTAQLARDGERLRVESLQLDGPAGTLTASGEGDRDGFWLQLATDGLDLRRIHGAIAQTQLRGGLKLQSLAIDPAHAPLPVPTEVAVSGALADGEIALSADLRATRELLTIVRAHARARDGDAQFQGTVSLDQTRRFALSGSLARFDPSRFADVPPGRLSGQWQASGQLEPALQVAGDLRLVNSQWRGQPLAGRVAGTWTPERVRDVHVDATLGANAVRAKGNLGAAGDRLTFSVNAPRVEQILPELAGSLRATGEVGNTFANPSLSAEVDSRRLSYQQRYSVDGLRLQVSVPDLAREALSVSARAQRVSADATQVEAVTLTLSGTRDAHRLQARANVAGAALTASMQGGWQQAGDAWRWDGSLRELAWNGRPRVALLEPFALHVSPNSVRAERLRLAVDDGRVDLELASWQQDGRIAARGAATRLPWEWVEPWLPAAPIVVVGDPMRWAARWDLAGRLGDGASWRGSAAVLRESGDFGFETVDPQGKRVLVPAELQRIEARVGIDAGRVDLRLDAAGRRLGTVQGRATTRLAFVDDSMQPDLNVPVNGEVAIDVPSLGWTRTLVGDAWRFDGSVRGRVSVGGTLAQPSLRGSVEGRNLIAEQLELGIRLHDGVLSAALDGERVDIAELRFRSGEGLVELAGTLDLREGERGNARLRVQRFPIPLGPGQRVVLSGQASATAAGRELRIAGMLRADEGVIELPSTSAPTVSDDVVIIRRDAEAPPPKPTPVRRKPAAEPQRDGFRVVSAIEIDLGERFHVFGNGIDARLAGAVTISGTPPELRATGTVQILRGTFVAYGRKLDIEKGVLTFTGPLDDPTVQIIAMRKFQPVEAGVIVTGTAKNPRVQLTSRPDVPDVEKLSWLVFGRGFEDARSAGQAAAVQGALLALQQARGGESGPGVAGRLGLDVLSIGAGTKPGEEGVVTLGKRLTDRLFVSYEQSLRGIHNLVRLQYELTDRLSLRVRTGSESSVDVVWTVPLN